MIARDRFDNGEDPPAATRDYVLQNWRADVVALANSSGNLLERVWYDPYGVPFATHPTDLTAGSTGATVGYGMPNGTLDSSDSFYFLALYGGTDWRTDWERDGDIDVNDYNAYIADKAAASGSWGRGVLSNKGNILGYAGYVHEPATCGAGGGNGTMWHIRHRVLHSGLGRWVQPDDARLLEQGMARFVYLDGSPMLDHDSSGMCSDGIGCNLVLMKCNRDFTAIGDRCKCPLTATDWANIDRLFCQQLVIRNTLRCPPGYTCVLHGSRTSFFENTWEEVKIMRTCPNSSRTCETTVQAQIYWWGWEWAGDCQSGAPLLPPSSWW